MSDIEHVEGRVREIHLAAESATILDAVENLSPGSISEPCFDVTDSSNDVVVVVGGGFPGSTESSRGSFSRTLHHSSGSITQIRAANVVDVDQQTVIARTERVPAKEASDYGEEMVRKVHMRSRGGSMEKSEILTTETVSCVDVEEDIADENAEGPLHVECTSSYLQEGVTQPHSDQQDEVDSSKPLPDQEELDYTQIPEWRNQRRQLFVFSNSGKPVYTRHGDEDRLVTLCGVMQAIVSVVNDTNDNQLWSMRAIGTTISFLIRTPLVLVTVAKTGESDRQLVLYLNYVYDFIISVLTAPQLSRIFIRYPNFDLRRMLSGTEKILDRLVDWFDEDFGFLLGAVRCMPLPPPLRESINSLLTHSCQKTPNLVFALVIAKRQLISVTRLKKYILHPSDIRILINLVDTSDSFKTAEAWIPICLPKFDAGGFLHAYIHYLRESPVCLIYLAVDPSLFHSLAQSSANFVSKMESSGNLDSVLAAMSSTAFYTVQQTSVVELRHFVYKASSAAQLTSPVIGHPYVDEEGRQILRGFYRYLHRKMHCPTRAAKIIVVTSNTEMLLGWVSGTFELYAVLEPSITKHQAVLAIEKLMRWMKKEESQLFTINSQVFS
ncbi:Vacuolar fusion protein MON1-like protein A [Hypsibius exemplaris]|uniref:Vacuolar fusion protein MON1 homolog n=1 Tax=Hypsibius exemplaris TaxID=2072580 RepID=A0A1W0WYJ4_HYPEX|nr:Vacuolar fusion protein MON1-like protein A [Hypsibius exemplaris]